MYMCMRVYMRVYMHTLMYADIYTFIKNNGMHMYMLRSASVFAVLSVTFVSLLQHFISSMCHNFMMYFDVVHL